MQYTINLRQIYIEGRRIQLLGENIELTGEVAEMKINADRFQHKLGIKAVNLIVHRKKTTKGLELLKQLDWARPTPITGSNMDTTPCRIWIAHCTANPVDAPVKEKCDP